MVAKSLTLIILPFLLLAAEWQSLNGPPAGRADDMSMGWHPEWNYWVIYAADQTHKLYKSTNEGEYWDSILDPYVTNPTCVITRPSDAQVVYIGKNGDVPVWKSEDGGQTWEPKSYGITNKNPLCFAMAPNNPHVLYAGFERYTGTDYTIFKTTNGGTEWYPCASGNPIHSYSIRKFVINPSNPQIIYAATNNSVWKSVNGGNDWIQLSSPPTGGNIYCITINWDAVPNIIFIGTIDLAGDCALLYRTSDDGNYWEEVLRLGPHYLENNPTALLIEKNTAGRIVYATFHKYKFYKSTDYGNPNSWQESSIGILDRNLLTLIQHPPTAGASIYWWTDGSL